MYIFEVFMTNIKIYQPVASEVIKMLIYIPRNGKLVHAVSTEEQT